MEEKGEGGGEKGEEGGADGRRAGAGGKRPPLQFSLRSLFVITALVGLLFGTLRWLEVPPLASAMVLVILIVSVAAAIGLVVAIAGASDDGE